ncbi:uncharacterized protein LOC144605548 [Rhinoraja longicauda]
MEKCQIRKSEVRYVGHLVTAAGLRPDPAKVEAVKRMPVPTNKKEVQQFLGFVQYLSEYIPHPSKVDEPLRGLTLRDAHFRWDRAQQRSFDKLKDLCTASPC